MEKDSLMPNTKDILNSIKLNPLFETVERRTMSDAEYFGDGLKGYISNSQLSLINPHQDGSPERFQQGFKNQGQSNSLDIGSAVHALILEPTKYTLNTTIDKPTGKVGPIMEHALMYYEGEYSTRDALKMGCMQHDYYTNSLTENRINALWEKGKEYYHYLVDNGLNPSDLILTKDNRNKAVGAVKSINTHQLAKDTLFLYDEIFDIKTYTEDVITMDVELDVDGTIVPISLKGKIDNFSVNFDEKLLIVNDLKTTGKPVENFMGYKYHDPKYESGIFVEGSFQRFHYNRQMAMYGWMLWNYAKANYKLDSTWKANVNMVVVESQAPHGVKVYRINKEWITKGYNEFVSLIKRVAWHNVYGYDKVI